MRLPLRPAGRLPCRRMSRAIAVPVDCRGGYYFRTVCCHAGLSDFADRLDSFVLSILMLFMTRARSLAVLEAPLDVEEHEEETLSRPARH